MLYLVTYTLRPSRDATSIITELQKSPRWWHYLDDTWLISTTESALELWNRVAKSFQTSDNILIVEFTPSAYYRGWLPKEAWDWIDKHRTD